MRSVRRSASPCRQNLDPEIGWPRGNKFLHSNVRGSQANIDVFHTRNEISPDIPPIKPVVCVHAPIKHIANQTHCLLPGPHRFGFLYAYGFRQSSVPFYTLSSSAGACRSRTGKIREKRPHTCSLSPKCSLLNSRVASDTITPSDLTRSAGTKDWHACTSPVKPLSPLALVSCPTTHSRDWFRPK